MKLPVLGLILLLITPLLAGNKPISELPKYQPDANATRAAIPEVYTWDLTPLAKSIQAWEQELTEAGNGLKELKSLQDGLKNDAGLLAYLQLYFKLDEQINRLTLYANMQRDVQSTDQQIIARHEKALGLTEALMRAGGPLRQAILNRSETDWQTAYKTHAGLAEFTPFIDNLRRRAGRVLSPGEEHLLGLAGDNLWAQIDLNELPAAPEKVFRAFMSEMQLPKIETADGGQVQLTFSNYGRFRGSDNRDLRRRTVEAMFGTLRSYENTLATMLGEQARFSLFLSKARGYDTVLEAYLDKDNLSPAVYLNLIETVKKNVKPLHKYVQLRQKALKLDKVHLYDLYVPMVKQEHLEMDYAQGVKLVTAALKPMGEEYGRVLQTGLDPQNGWIDVYPSKEKNSGAFSTASYGIHPYVKMNFQNSFDDVSTLAHEFGHALHSYYSMNNQSALAWRYPPFLAEIASTCNEALLSRYMIEHAKSKTERAWLLSELLETIRTTIYRQTLFAEFELRLHQLAEKGEAINAAKLNKIYGELLRTYYGPDYAIDANDAIEWAYIPHFYYKYYVFTYATGLSSGIAFAEKILTEGKPARDAYLGMLKGGASKPPLVLLKEAGVDLTKPQAIESALQLFDRTVDELNTLLSESGK